MQQKDIPIFAEFFEHFPRPEPPLHLKLTTDQAAVIIQKRWKGTITRRRPDIKALRRHIAAARIQYNDPRRLVEELWNRDIPIPPPPLELSCVSLSDNNPVHSPQIGSLTDVAANTRKDSTATPALPKFLQISKTDVQNRLTQSRGKTEGQRKKASPACEKNKDSGDSDEEPEEKPVPVEVAIVVPTAPPLPDPAPSNPLDGTGTSRNSLNKAGAHGGGLTADGLGKGGGPSMVPKISKDKQVTGSGGEKKAAKAPKAK
ncbi:hypothetical protein BV898_06657 [Hypsibius exemplaris]|nr:hypothetical protein BV898_06657 [Hypsibius exemplaris]